MSETTGRHRADRLLQLSKRVNAAQWGPGRFAAALRQAIADGAIRQVGRGEYELPAQERRGRPSS